MRIKLLNKLADALDTLGNFIIALGESCQRCTDCGKTPLTAPPCSLFKSKEHEHGLY